MKSLIKKIFLWDTKVLRFIRNEINFKPVIIDVPRVKETISISDSFLWRTDEGFKTIVRIMDLLNIFYDLKDNFLEIQFFSQNHKFIKKIDFQNLKLSNEIIIDKEFMNSIEGYGTFYIFHKHTSHKLNNVILSDRSYVGYSQNNNLISFAHGNIYAISENLDSNKSLKNFIPTSILPNKKYSIQNNLEGFDKTELVFTNPTSKKIVYFINNSKNELNPHCIKLVQLQKPDQFITIKSNCNFLRPIIFNYKKQFLDVYHS